MRCWATAGAGIAQHDIHNMSLFSRVSSNMQMWEWQLEELALYFLLYTEAANLRHLPEALWFLFWVLRNSPHRMAQVRKQLSRSGKTTCQFVQSLLWCLRVVATVTSPDSKDDK